MLVYMNGDWIKEETAAISINNPGFTNAQVVYETIRTYQGELFQFKKHYDRLRNSAEAMSIDLSKGWKEVESIIHESILKNVLKEAYIRIYLTSTPDLIIQVKAFPEIDPDLYDQGVLTDITEIRRQAFMHNETAIKTTAALDVFLARIKRPKHLYDFIMLNREGYVAEGTFSNVFLVKDNTLITPSMKTGILSGITREVVIELAEKNGLKCEKKLVEEKELFEADELFLTHTSAGIAPIKAVGSRQYPIGSMTRQLIKVLKAFTG
ncbi:MAG TPA: aminotransferase class IV [Thermotogota bacterium]|nr:aminotransferase class IV [Thermotogota bacterium]HRW34482.1 aminotransferase class IV [Thermotogota bacterium]